MSERQLQGAGGKCVFKEKSLNWEKVVRMWPGSLQSFLHSSQHLWDGVGISHAFSPPVVLAEEEVDCPESRFCARVDSAWCGQIGVRLGDIFGEKNQLYPDWGQGPLTSCDLFLGWVGGWMVALLFCLLKFEIQPVRDRHQSIMWGFLFGSHVMNRKVLSSQLSHSLWKFSSRRCWPKCQRGCFWTGVITVGGDWLTGWKSLVFSSPRKK